MALANPTIIAWVLLMSSLSRSFAENAERDCERLLKEALNVDPNSPEALQTLASFKISQQDLDAALNLLNKSFSVWKDEEGMSISLLSLKLDLSSRFLSGCKGFVS